MSSDLEQRPEGDEVQKLAAAYTDAAVAHSVIVDLVDAGLSEADVTVMHPWPVDRRGRRAENRFLDHPHRTALVTAVALGGITSLSAWMWADPGQWLIYGLLGLALGVVTGSLAGALTATSPPHWHERLLGDPLGAVTVEVTTTDPESAGVARLVMAAHDPSLVLAETEPGPRPPAERVLWDHDDGLSPLEELGSWVESRAERPPRPAPRRRGRHIQA